MDVIAKFANRFVQRHINGRIRNYDEVIEAAKEQLYTIDNRLDKIKFLNIILEGNNIVYDQHKPNCTAPDTCHINLAHESITYFLAQELARLGVQLNEDTFTIEEEGSVEAKLDTIIKDLGELKLGHQIIYDDLKKELEELKGLYFLGKKKWHQLFAGKCLDMVAGGVISETVSKKIITALEPAFTRVIES